MYPKLKVINPCQIPKSTEAIELSPVSRRIPLFTANAATCFIYFRILATSLPFNCDIQTSAQLPRPFHLHQHMLASALTTTFQPPLLKYCPHTAGRLARHPLRIVAAAPARSLQLLVIGTGFYRLVRGIS